MLVEGQPRCGRTSRSRGILPLRHSRLCEQDGGISGLLASGQDLTQQRAAEAEIRAHRQRLESLVAARTAELTAVNRELESFAYPVSHDLRAPLRCIDGFSQALVEDFGEQLDATARDYLNRIVGSSARMGALIDSLLHLSRVTRGPMVRAKVDLSAIARRAPPRFTLQDACDPAGWPR